MNWTVLIETITALLTTGGVVYLIIEKLFDRKRTREEVKTIEISNGNDIANLYNKIDEIVERKTVPIKAELSEVKAQLAEIKSRWCCYREDCDKRLLYRKNIITQLKNESENQVCTRH